MEHYMDKTDSEGMSAQRSKGFSPWGLECMFQQPDVLLPTWMLPFRRPTEVLEDQRWTTFNSAKENSNSTVHLTQKCKYVINTKDFEDIASLSATKRHQSPPLTSTDSKRFEHCQSTPFVNGIVEVRETTE
ncbi:hypothetical protein KC19_VG112000 [Ceratodon purpureus]|uniref:Uncharacterized protein n=1 Tax=Ceratodon purpureus TaxID=3225 RepID=A0A8T0HNX7_CERPU|nr:hypothetical protein KC19_VG112000 [Ceratodon purpureus]